MGFKRLLTSQVMKSNDEVDMEEWADDPEHTKLVETDRSLREQEEKDTEVATMYQEKYDKNKDPQEEEDREVAMVYRKLYSQNATEAQVASASTNWNLAQEVKHAGRETSPMEGGRGEAAAQVKEHADESCHR
ncbi:hypothetical protein ACQJBY_069750 [Aegilops geniculata]